MIIFLVGALFCPRLPLLASTLDQSTTPAGSAFAEACAGIGYSSFLDPGNPWVPGINGAGGATVCNSSAGANPAWTAFNTGSKAGQPPYIDNAASTGALGKLKFAVSHSGSADYFFPEGYADAGWNDVMTAKIPGLADGQSGNWVIPINIAGTLATSGPGARSGAAIEIFQNGIDIQSYGGKYTAAYNEFAALNTVSNGCIGPSWSQEIVAWGSSGTDSACQNLNVVTTVDFVLPAVVGQQYEIGIWADISAGEGSAGLPPPGTPLDVASADLSHTILWGGPGYFINDADGQVYDVDITSGSGYDYNVAATDTSDTPEPSSALLVLGGIVLIFVSRLRISSLRRS